MTTAKKQTSPKTTVKKTAPKTAKVAQVEKTPHKKTLVGVVVSDKMQKTIVVKVDRQVRHTLYKKYVAKTRKFKAHDEKNTAKIGDLVTIVESRPLSRDKRWALQKIVRKAIQTADANI
jgi:small subunit ribosomal protein S17